MHTRALLLTTAAMLLACGGSTDTPDSGYRYDASLPGPDGGGEQDAGLDDGGVTDAGSDAGSDAGLDAGSDAGNTDDAGSDAGLTDAGLSDAGADAGTQDGCQSGDRRDGITACGFTGAGVLVEQCSEDGGWSETALCDDPTVITQLIDVRPGDAGSNPKLLTALGEGICFGGSNGTVFGQVLCTHPDGGVEVVSNLSGYASLGADALRSNGTLLYFNEYANGARGLYLTDGTAAGTRTLAETSFPTELGAWLPDGGFVFEGDGPSGNSVYFSDGTDAGLRMVQDVEPDGGNTIYLLDFTPIGDSAFFMDGYGQVWRTDGTDAGTAKVAGANARSGTTDGYMLRAQTVAYTAGLNTNADAFKVSRVDLQSWTTTSTTIPGTFMEGFAAYGDEVALSTGGVVTLTDGTAGGTQTILSNLEGPMHSLGETLIVASYAGVRGVHAWTPTDGGVLVREVIPDSDGELVPCAGSLCFAAYDERIGWQLWATDGTPQGTYALSDLPPGAQGSVPRSLVASGNAVYFTFDDGEHGLELWKVAWP